MTRLDRTRRFLRKTALPAFLICLVIFVLSGCSASVLDQLFGPAWTWPSLETANTSATDRTTGTTPTGTTPSATQANTRDRPSQATITGSDKQTLDFSAPTPAFDARIEALLEEGLEKRERSIILDAAFSDWLVRENQVQDAIDRIYALYTGIYLSQPRFFYLNGSFQVYYSVLRGGDNAVAGLRIEPAFWSSTENLSDAELTDLIWAVDAVVAVLADQIRSASSQPREQLVLLHDWLIRNIVYDPTGDQGNNHAGSALLGRVTLCQGYAQAFQLVGQALGIEVRLITGTADGIGHAWNQVVLDGVPYHVDVTHDDPTPDGGEDHPVRHVHLFRSDRLFSLTHQWDTQLFEPCPTDGAFYYRDRGLVVHNLAALEKEIGQFVSQIELKDSQTWQLELFYDATELPEQAALDALLKTALQQISADTVYYRADLDKGIVVCQVSDSR